jgi:DNA polymerase III delta prime subunit
MLSIHQNINEKLNYFYENDKIPNLLFHGPTGSGKRTILHDFINKIYDNDRNKIKNYVMSVNCSHGKGIKFIRDELKFFAKTNINSNEGKIFKSIILLNGDKLTIDAQSALRRCIELFSHNSRFFIVAEDKYSLMKPILSRFCEIYIPLPSIKLPGTNKTITVNLYKHTIQNTFPFEDIKSQRNQWLKKELHKLKRGKCLQEIEPLNSASSTLDGEHSKTPSITVAELIQCSNKFYEKGYSALDIIRLIDEEQFRCDFITEEKRYEMLVCFHKIKSEFRNEKLLMLFLLHFLFLSLEFDLENISFM